ncbi:MAG: hypothetical protein IKR45_03885 [Treponema sp.]|nr:hypothetical protein [Treponema sp.]
MKRFNRLLTCSVMVAMLVGLSGCSFVDKITGKDPYADTVYQDFVNYPKGKQNSKGLLTLTNEANTSVLVFTDSVDGENYIGTIPSLSSINVMLEPGRFYSIVTVSKDAFEMDQDLAVQSSVLVYYSDIQAYTVSVSPENLTGSATWIFNNHTSYWVSVEKIDSSGEAYAVIAPMAKQVSVPVQTNRNYDYRVVYKKQLKYKGNIIAISNKTSCTENDTASFMNLTTFTTDLYGDATNDNSDLAPTVKFVNQTGKTLRVYNGQIQLTDTGITADDYTLASGVSAFFTGFTEGTSLSNLNIRNVAWNGNYYCTDTTTKLENGYVYIITVRSSDGSYSGSGNSDNKSPVSWYVNKEPANHFYTEE